MRRPPEEYLDMDYINWHLRKFASGASYLVPKDILDKWGRDILGWPDNSQFVMASPEMDAMLAKTKGNVSEIEKEPACIIYAFLLVQLKSASPADVVPYFKGLAGQ